MARAQAAPRDGRLTPREGSTAAAGRGPAPEVLFAAVIAACRCATGSAAGPGPAAARVRPAIESGHSRGRK